MTTIDRIKLGLFYPLRIAIVATRKAICWKFGHKMEWTGYYEAAKQGSSFKKIEQCVRCRMIDRSAPDSVVVRFDKGTPYNA